MQTPYQQYKKNAKIVSSPAEGIAQYFDEAATSMEAAAIAIDNNDIEKRYNDSQHAANIMSGLSASLNRDTPEQETMAQTLDDYYSSMIVMIGRMNIKNDRALCLSIRDSFKEMAKCWREAGAAYAKGQEEKVESASSAVPNPNLSV